MSKETDDLECGKPSPTRSKQKYEVARRELEKHLSLFPGDYRIMEGANSNHNNAYRVWVRKKVELQDLLRVLETLTEKTGLPYDQYPKLEPPERLQPIKNHSVDSYITAFNESMEFLNNTGSHTEEWKKERTRAAFLRRRIIDSCHEKGLPQPKLLNLPQVEKQMLRLCADKKTKE